MRSVPEIRRMAREALAGRWPRSIALAAIALLLGGVSTSAFLLAQFGSLLATSVAEAAGDGRAGTYLRLLVVVSSVYSIIGIAVGSFVELGHDRYYLKLLSGEEPALTTAFSCRKIWVKALILRAFTCITALLWGVLLVVPGFLALIRYALAPFALAQDPDLELSEAIRTSKAYMQGCKKEYALLVLSFSGYLLLSYMTFGAGFLFAIPYIKAAKAQFFLERAAHFGKEAAGKRAAPPKGKSSAAAPPTEPDGYYE